MPRTTMLRTGMPRTTVPRTAMLRAAVLHVPAVLCSLANVNFSKEVYNT